MDATFSQEFGEFGVGQTVAQGGADGKGNNVVGKILGVKCRGGARREASSAYTTPLELACLMSPSRIGTFLRATSIALHVVPVTSMSHDAVYSTPAPPNGPLEGTFHFLYRLL